ncbi:MAG: hypothetical protein DYH08_15210 [Actinobacteria bacterium ATB1]|nr:hypothetical protein [Actinobacteria bacterium ATB1]
MADPQSGQFKTETDPNAALNEQVKLLVKTEQRLHRAQADLDRKLRQTQALADLALACAEDLDASAIVESCIDTLEDLFDADDVAVFLRRGDGSGGWKVKRLGAAMSEIPGSCGQRAACRHAQADSTMVFTVGEGGVFPDGVDCADTAPVSSCLSFQEGDVVALVALEDDPGTCMGMLVLRKRASRPRSFYRESLTAESVPFLLLLAAHVERALANAWLKRDLGERTAELVESNRRLTQSLTDLHEVTAELRRSELRQRAIIEAQPDLLAVLDCTTSS